MKRNKKINLERLEKELDRISDFENDSEKFQFEKMVLNSEFVHLIHDLMDKSKTHNSKEELAKELGITKKHLSNIFANNKFLDLDTLVKIQRIYNIRFQITIK